MRTSRLFFGALALTLGLGACVEPVTEPQVDVEPDLSLEALRFPDFQLTVLHSNDGESDLLPGDEFGGIARFGRTVAELREEATSDCQVSCAVVLLSSGDNFLAGPQFNASLANGVPFFDAQAQDLIGYDASAIGNHEFDFGPEVLADYIESFSMTDVPFLSANLDVSGEPRLAALQSEGRIARSTIVEVPVFGPRKGRRGHWRRGSWGGDDHDDDDDDDDDDRGRSFQRMARIGVIGATTPNLASISSPRNVIVLQDVAARINREVWRLRRRGVDKIVLISHLQGIDSDLELIPMLRGVDIAVAGGGDELLANATDAIIPGDDVFGPYPLQAMDRRGRQVPVITTSGSYEYVGRLVAQFSRSGRVIDYEGGPILVQGAADPQLEALIEQPVADAVATLQASVIGTTEVGLDGVRANVRTRETNEGNLIADALRWQATELAGSFGVPAPDVALQNGGGIRNDAVFPAGDITEFDAFSFVPFANFVSIIPDISRAQFLEILENAVSAVEFTSGRFAQVSGFSFSYDPAAAAGSRVVDVTLDGGEVIVAGGVVQAGDDLTIATIDFLARGGDDYPYNGAPFTSVGVTYQNALSNYIQQALGGTVTAADYPEGGEGRITALGS